MKYISTILLCCVLSVFAHAQGLDKLFDSTATGHTKVRDTYKSTRIVQGQSTEMLRKHELDFRVTHRFGDAGGEFGGTKTFFGTDNSTDIRIAFEYGVSDNLMVGISRTKGSGDLQQLYEGLVKYRFLQQTTDNHVPLSLAVFGNAVISGMPSATDKTSAAYFEDGADRLMYVAQAIVSRKFGDKLSLTLSPTYIHRNHVAYMDMNNMFALGAAGRLKLSKRMGFLAEYYYPFRSQESKDYFKSARGISFYNPLAVGLEIETGGHVFSITFTNSTAIQESQFIPETTTSWLQGQFRWGFNISRRFTLFGKKDWKK
ncbi:DUF5777 family beta-barrel protein [Chitinophaga ginsengisegetis]|uniref:DUF5777 family beta-barrel protein n=1 Tax=Chitinophaga ginsengisegetis TaxID=393003 RepID=UPI000DBA905B|nr:DUF5777 family beta-barrel protein [Chitinophaga ginsengisegetis]MDR6565735.1 hypothetical protein [Chitinophaga ginsengisegetis]MDR6645464.1 hypothetical protein [Chitinophaga ginsengisegetis]MDR6651944.1 hypothetical protein [Chitinophaga ginsengisegetis]